MLIYKIGMHGKSSVMYDHGVDQCFLSLAASNVTCQEFENYSCKCIDIAYPFGTET
jgi:hypothetical protein